jgi:hypothetical protein
LPQPSKKKAGSFDRAFLLPGNSAGSLREYVHSQYTPFPLSQIASVLDKSATSLYVAAMTTNIDLPISYR